MIFKRCEIQVFGPSAFQRRDLLRSPMMPCSSLFSDACVVTISHHFKISRPVQIWTEIQMYETVSTASGSSTEEHKAESSKNEVVLKGCAEKTLKNDALTPPARLIPARRMPRYNPAKLSKEIYDLFVSGLKYGEPAYPGTKELRNLGFQTSKGTSHRKRFRKLIHRFELDVVQGSLVYSPNLEEDVILYKRTGKIILHDENLEKVILRAHLWGNNFVNDENKDKAKPCHFDVGATLAEVSGTCFLKFSFVAPGGWAVIDYRKPPNCIRTANCKRFLLGQKKGTNFWCLSNT